MAGVLVAIKLREAGFTDVAVYEKADRLGGTWRQNTYPGIACDVPAHLYTYSFAPNPEWSHAFAPGPEILAYFEAVARRYGVDELIRYGREVRRLEHDGSLWRMARRRRRSAGLGHRRTRECGGRSRRRVAHQSWPGGGAVAPRDCVAGAPALGC